MTASSFSEGAGVAAAAAEYRERGWCVVPVRPRAKRPGVADHAAWRELWDRPECWHEARLDPDRVGDGSGWEYLRLGVQDFQQCLGPDGNIGLNLGEPSGGLADVDLDCAESIELADAFLPETWTFGRPSKPRSHWLYQSPGCVTQQFKLPSGEVLLELRGTPRANVGRGIGGSQTVVPPSVHPSGELITWAEDCDAAEAPRCIDEGELARRGAALAAAVVIGRHDTAGLERWLSGGSFPSLPEEEDRLVRRWLVCPQLSQPRYSTAFRSVRSEGFFAALRSVHPFDVASAFGQELADCPACGLDTRSRSDRRRPAVTTYLGADGTPRWKHHGCGAGGDAAALAAVLSGGGANAGVNWSLVRRACAEKGLWHGGN